MFRMTREEFDNIVTGERIPIVRQKKHNTSIPWGIPRPIAMIFYERLDIKAKDCFVHSRSTQSSKWACIKRLQSSIERLELRLIMWEYVHDDSFKQYNGEFTDEFISRGIRAYWPRPYTLPYNADFDGDESLVSCWS